MPAKTMHKTLIFGINSFENFKKKWQKGIKKECLRKKFVKQCRLVAIGALLHCWLLKCSFQFQPWINFLQCFGDFEGCKLGCGSNSLNHDNWNLQQLWSTLMNQVWSFGYKKIHPYPLWSVDRKYNNYLEVLLQVGSGQVQQVSYKKMIFMTTQQSFQHQQKQETQENLSVYLDKCKFRSLRETMG